MKMLRIPRELAAHLGVYAGLCLFGWLYNLAVERLHSRRGRGEGFTWALVTFGAGVTIVATWPLIGSRNTLRVILAFAASGFFMAWGDMQRYWRKLDAEYKFGERHGNQTTRTTHPEITPALRFSRRGRGG